jgi:signal peptidase
MSTNSNITMQDSSVKKQSKGAIAKRVIMNSMLALSLLVVSLAVIWALFLKTDDAFIFGYKPYIVVSESMQPTIQKYAFVLIEQTDYDEIAVGEVIAFKSSQVSGVPVLHRVVDITPEGIVTKGDAVDITDESVVTRNNFLGRRLWHTNLLARVFQICQTPQGFFLVVILPCLVVVTLCVVFTFDTKKSKRRHIR